MSRKSPVISLTAPMASFEKALQAVDGVPKSKQRGVRILANLESIEQARKTASQNGFSEGFSKGRQEGFERGIAAGHEAGRLEAKNEADVKHDQILSDFMAELTTIRAQLEVAIGDWFTQSEEAMTGLAMAAVRKILVSELSISRDSALDIVKEALSEVTHSKHARIRLNPFDSSGLAKYRSEILAAAGSLRDIEFVDDRSITGGCVIETDGGVVDARLETRLTLLENALQEAA